MTSDLLNVINNDAQYFDKNKMGQEDYFSSVNGKIAYKMT